MLTFQSKLSIEYTKKLYGHVYTFLKALASKNPKMTSNTQNGKYKNNCNGFSFEEKKISARKVRTAKG